MGILATVKSVFDTLKEPFNAAGRFFNPDRRREARKDGAIGAASELIALQDAIIDKSGKYADYPRTYLDKYRIHFRKQFERWRNG